MTMKGTLAWIIFGLAALTCLLWIGFGVRDDLREDDVFHNIIQERIDIAESSEDTLHIGAAGDWDRHQEVLHGIQLAADEINATGGILGRTIVVDPQDDQGTVEGALTVAQSFASRPEIGIVVGHTGLSLTAAVAQNYEFYGLLCITPNTASNNSSKNRFSLIFENGISPQQTGGAILKLAKEKQWKRLGLIYAKSTNAMHQARRFESMANRHEINIPLSFAYEGRGSGVAEHMERWKRELDLDAMILTVDAADIIPLVSACRVIGINCPFVIVSEPPASLTAKKTEGLNTLYFIDPLIDAAAHDALAPKTQARFNHGPTIDLLLGYDSLIVLKQAIIKADSFVPARVAEALRNAPIDESMSGTLRFDKHGSAIKRPPHFTEY